MIWYVSWFYVIVSYLQLLSLPQVHSLPLSHEHLTTTIITSHHPSLLHNYTELRQTLEDLLQSEQTEKVLILLEEVESYHHSLIIDSPTIPSFYTYRGVALFELNRIHEAVISFRQAVEINPMELRAWMNLLQILPSIGEDCEDVLLKIEELGGYPILYTRYERGYWSNLESLQAEQDVRAMACVSQPHPTTCTGESITPALIDSEKIELLKRVNEVFWKFSIENRSIAILPRRHTISALNNDLIDGRKESNRDVKEELKSSSISGRRLTSNNMRLSMGIILQGVGPGPVQSLAQGFFHHLNKRGDIRLELFVLSRTNGQQWPTWLTDMLNQFHQIHYLDNVSPKEAAYLMHQRNLDVIMEMTGLSLPSGLPALAYRPAPVQISFIGDPYTLGAAETIDYFMTDAVSCPVEYGEQAFSERLALLPGPYLLSSHANWQSSLLTTPPPTKTEVAVHFRKIANGDLAGENWEERILLGAFHGTVKIDPTVFHLWMNILRRAPHSTLVTTSGKYSDFLANRLKEINFHGATNEQVVLLEGLPWDQHIMVKSGLDLYLDTLIKNGHTTTVDAMWAGLPIIGLEGRKAVGTRSTASLVHYLDSTLGLVPSLKAYEDLVISLIGTDKGRSRLNVWKKEARRLRMQSRVFDIEYISDEVVTLCEATLELQTRNSTWPKFLVKKKYHVFASYARE